MGYRYLEIKKGTAIVPDEEALSRYAEMLEQLLGVCDPEDLSAIYVSPDYGTYCIDYGIHCMDYGSIASPGNRLAFEAFASMSCGCRKPIPCIYLDLSSKSLWMRDTAVIGALCSCGYIEPPAIVLYTPSRKDPRKALSLFKANNEAILWTDNIPSAKRCLIPQPELCFDGPDVIIGTPRALSEVSKSVSRSARSIIPYSWNMFAGISGTNYPLSESSSVHIVQESMYGRLADFAKSVSGDPMLDPLIDDLVSAYESVLDVPAGVAQPDSMLPLSDYQPLRRTYDPPTGKVPDSGFASYTSISMRYRFKRTGTVEIYGGKLRDKGGSTSYSDGAETACTHWRAREALSDALDIAKHVWMAPMAGTDPGDIAQSEAWEETPFGLWLDGCDPAHIAMKAESRLLGILEHGRELGIDSLIGAIADGVPVQDALAVFL